MSDWLVLRAVDAAIAFVLLEALCLVVLRRRSGRGVAVAGLLFNLAAGLWLMLGIRAALSGAAWPWLPACLLGAGLAHALDVRFRWRQEQVRTDR